MWFLIVMIGVWVAKRCPLSISRAIEMNMNLFGAIVKYLFARDLLKRPLISPNGRNKSIIPTRTELCLFWRQTNSAVLRPWPGSLEWLITSAVMNVENFGEKPTNCETPIPENWGCRIEWNALQSAALSDFHPNSFAFISNMPAVYWLTHILLYILVLVHATWKLNFVSARLASILHLHAVQSREKHK